MSITDISLRKLIKIMYLDQNRRISALRGDIREDIARDAGNIASGGDFYAPFWFDAKEHVFDRRDLHEATEERIKANPRRERLYPLLKQGFLSWWDDRRRWTNSPFEPAELMRSRYRFPDINAVVKIDSVLSVRDAHNEDHFVYPYFSPEPILSDEAGRLSLWLLNESLPNADLECIRVLDVMRGQTFSADRNPLTGDEYNIFISRYSNLINERNILLREYE